MQKSGDIRRVRYVSRRNERGMKMIKYVQTILFLILILPGCSQNDDIKNSIKALKQQYDSTIVSIEKKVDSIQAVIMYSEYIKMKEEEINVDPSSAESYQTIKTSNGMFFIALKEVRPYLNGYKLILQIGNPYAITFKGFKLKVTWGRDFAVDMNDSVQTDYDLQTKEEAFVKELSPAAWTKVELILAPAKTEQLEYIRLSMSVNIVSLQTNEND